MSKDCQKLSETNGDYLIFVKMFSGKIYTFSFDNKGKKDNFSVGNNLFPLHHFLTIWTKKVFDIFLCSITSTSTGSI